jgi:hypothetical protein
VLTIANRFSTAELALFDHYTSFPVTTIVFYDTQSFA